MAARPAVQRGLLVPAPKLTADAGSADKFIRKVDAGEIDIPLVRIEGSSKCARGVPLIDLAAYIDARASEARAVNDKIHGRKGMTSARQVA